MREWLGRVSLPLLRAADAALGRAHALAGDASRTARFLHGRARFQPRPDDVYVGSYPRSGTTWTLTLVQLLTSGAEKLEFDHLSDVAPWWERSLAWRADAPESMASLRSPRLFKTHLPRRWLPGPGRFLYVVRDPADVAVSYFHLHREYLSFTGSFDDFLGAFLEGRVQYRSYFRHVASWEVARADPRVLFLPYSALKADTAGWVLRIARFLSLRIGRDRARRIAQAAAFPKMKAAEAKFDHAGELLRQWGVRGRAFLREGADRRGRGVLDAQQHARLERARRERFIWPELEWRLPDFLH